MAAGRVRQHERGEPEGEAADEGGRPPAHPARHHQVRRAGAQGGRQGEGDVEAGHGSEQPRHRREGQAQRQHPGVRQQVHPTRRGQGGRVEGAVTVTQGVSRPLEEPGGQGGVTAAAAGEGGGVAGPDVPPQVDGENHVRGDRGDTRPQSGTPTGDLSLRRPRPAQSPDGSARQQGGCGAVIAVEMVARSGRRSADPVDAPRPRTASRARRTPRRARSARASAAARIRMPSA